ncbi:MAG TPA: hypothetical protein DEA22_11765 [Blastocatellia bacterium]|nr:hypothetical protein [Blastocatellia bacterium]
MDMAHLHLMLNHFPLMGALFGTPILAYALLRKNDSLRNTALVIFVFAAAIAIPVYLTGEPAEEIVEHLPGVSHDAIETHEDSALFALWAAIGAGVVSAVGLILALRAKAAANTVALIALLFGIVTAGLMARTANLGGEVRHTEIRGTGTTQQVEGTSKPEKDDDDDH